MHYDYASLGERMPHSRDPHQNLGNTLAMTHAYKETPGVKKLSKGYKLLPKEALSGFGVNVLKSSFITFMCTLIVAGIVYAAAALLDISTLWSTVIILLLGTVLWSWLMHPVFSWMFISPKSPIVISKEQRANLKKTRLIAAQLGKSVVPVLTEEHIAATYRVFFSLVRTPGPANQTDHDRITVLLLEDLNREPLLIDLITNRGINAMSEIEEALRDIESNVTGPVQRGWL